MKIRATAADSGRRVDQWIEGRLNGLSRTRIQSLIRNGHITVNRRVVKAHARVREGLEAEIELPAPEPASVEAENIPLDILYEDADILVLNKPAGLVVHPAAGHRAGTLVNALLFHCHDLAGIGGELRPGLVHRLDKDTSGALVVAKNDLAMAGLVGQFKEGRVRKEYVALVHGTPKPPEGRIETLIGRSPRDRKKMSARPNSGRRAVTHYRVDAVYGDICRVRVRIETGRTHQIRVHMAHLGHPVVGDTQYGRRKTDLPAGLVARQMLHAERLGLTHPRTGREMLFVAPLPPDMRAVLELLSKTGLDKTPSFLGHSARPLAAIKPHGGD